jgi:hypothetical protein
VGVGSSLVVGPLRGLDGLDPVRATVTLLEPSAELPLRGEIDQMRVAESGTRRFVVTWHECGARFDGNDGEIVVADNPAGGNRVAWTPSLDRFWLTASSSPQLSWVHARFVLRHLTTLALTADSGGRAVHAVTARLPDGRLVVTAGPTQSGKTRIVNRLTAANVVSEIDDDDCPVLTNEGKVWTLMPTRYELRRARSGDLAGIVVLTEGHEVTPWAADQAAAFLSSTPVSWPAAWLPGGESSRVSVPANVPVVAAPARTDDHDAVVARLAEVIGSWGSSVLR